MLSGRLIIRSFVVFLMRFVHLCNCMHDISIARSITQEYSQAMKKLILLLLIFTMSVSMGLAQSLSINFNSSTDLDSFNQYNVGGTAKNTTNGLQQADGIGTGTVASGGVQFVPSTGQTDLSAINTTAFSFVGGGGYVYSIDFHKQANIANSTQIIQMGFSSANNRALGWTATDLLSVQLLQSGANTGQLRIGSRTTADSSTTYTNLGSTFALNATNTDWLRLSVTLTLTNEAASQFSYTINLYDIGSTGTDALSTPLQSVTGTYINTGIATDASVYLGFRYLGTSAAAVDNLSLEAVPEPRSTALVLGGFIVVSLIGLQRRCRIARRS